MKSTNKNRIFHKKIESKSVKNVTTFLVPQLSSFKTIPMNGILENNHIET